MVLHIRQKLAIDPISCDTRIVAFHIEEMWHQLPQLRAWLKAWQWVSQNQLGLWTQRPSWATYLWELFAPSGSYESNPNDIYHDEGAALATIVLLTCSISRQRAKRMNASLRFLAASWAQIQNTQERAKFLGTLDLEWWITKQCRRWKETLNLSLDLTCGRWALSPRR